MTSPPQKSYLLRVLSNIFESYKHDSVLFTQPNKLLQCSTCGNFQDDYFKVYHEPGGVGGLDSGSLKTKFEVTIHWE
ncbi:hypothetical protein N7468_005185 [Penicillium chermesinum]|uniref:Uncharacterized protein n=1 Tax=Penicillium chermesinum TaxID=63820 RepID=A0A9W9NYT1_9EURO|nr:uncharacterized protein N7468_005185 [Penicillium chermesinum]KAJ5232229.1 hypothetical protein N7468_005185 [Penicillium chermesinum]